MKGFLSMNPGEYAKATTGGFLGALAWVFENAEITETAITIPRDGNPVVEVLIYAVLGFGAVFAMPNKGKSKEA